MTKKFLVAAVLATFTIACSKKAETTDSATTVDSTATETVVDSSNAPAKDSAAVAATATETATYVSNDGKTTFTATFNAEEGTAVVKNETTGETYNMKSAVSADGAKFADDKGNFFWTHKDGFDFGKDDKTTITGKEKK